MSRAPSAVSRRVDETRRPDVSAGRQERKREVEKTTMMVWSFVAGLRRRWTMPDNEPGAVALLDAEAESNGRAVRNGVKVEFMCREPVIACPHPRCAGMLVTGRRELIDWGRTGSRVVLRCSREPQEHSFTLSMEPYTVEEHDRFKVALHRSEGPCCPRCGTGLQAPSANGNGNGGAGGRDRGAYRCGWCGLRWLPGSDAQRRVS